MKALFCALVLVSCAGQKLPATPKVPAAVDTTASVPARGDVLEARVPSGSLVFHVRAAPLANLAYQLDCLAGNIACSKSVFQELWDPSWSVADDAALDVWRAMRGRYAGSLKLAGPPSIHGKTRLSYGDRVRAASLVSTSLDDYVRLLDVLLLLDDTPRLRAVLEHFWPRFLAWWETRGRAIVAEPVSRVAALFADVQFSGLLEQVTHFYAPELPKGTDIWFNLIARPASATETRRTAEASDNHMVIEVVAGESVLERMPVVAHELFHFFHHARSAASKDKLRERFNASPDPLAMVAYGLLNESLATLLGNVVIGRLVAPGDTAERLNRDKGLYENQSIDRTAKALVAGADVLQGGTIDDDSFVKTYLRAVHRALGDSPAPLVYLREFMLARAPALEKSGQRFIRQTEAESIPTIPLSLPVDVDDLARNPNFTVVMMLQTRDLPVFDAYAKSLGTEAIRAIHAEVKRGVPFAYALPRPPHAVAFVLVADDEASMNALADALVARQAPLQGVMR